MRTTLDIDDNLLKEAKQLAAREHTSLTRLIEEGLAARLRSAAKPEGSGSRVRLPVFAGRGGLQAGIRDARSHQAILDALGKLPDRLRLVAAGRKGLVEPERAPLENRHAPAT